LAALARSANCFPTALAASFDPQVDTVSLMDFSLEEAEAKVRP